MQGTTVRHRRQGESISAKAWLHVNTQTREYAQEHTYVKTIAAHTQYHIHTYIHTYINTYMHTYTHTTTYTYAHTCKVVAGAHDVIPVLITGLLNDSCGDGEGEELLGCVDALLLPTPWARFRPTLRRPPPSEAELLP